MFSSYNALSIENLLRAEAALPPYPPASDRGAWEAVRARLGDARTLDFIQQAEQAAREGIPSKPAACA